MLLESGKNARMGFVAVSKYVSSSAQAHMSAHLAAGADCLQQQLQASCLGCMVGVMVVAHLHRWGQLRGDLRTSCVFVVPDGEVSYSTHVFFWAAW
jgi:hypothetical protein